jgi:hypothetical protein
MDVHTLRGMVQETIRAAEPHVVGFVEALFKIIVWDDIGVSSALFVLSLLISILGTQLTDLQIVTVIFIFAFTAPIVYEKNKAHIDPSLKRLLLAVRAYTESVKLKAS